MYQWRHHPDDSDTGEILMRRVDLGFHECGRAVAFR
jgi:hypothetical protein